MESQSTTGKHKNIKRFNSPSAPRSCCSREGWSQSCSQTREVSCGSSWYDRRLPPIEENEGDNDSHQQEHLYRFPFCQNLFQCSWQFSMVQSVPLSDNGTLQSVLPFLEKGNSTSIHWNLDKWHHLHPDRKLIVMPALTLCWLRTKQKRKQSGISTYRGDGKNQSSS